MGNKKPKVTMKDIAALAGVSRQAVQAVLNGSRTVKTSTEKRLQILELVAATGYRPNLPARILNGKSPRTIAIFMSFCQVLIYQELQRSLARYLTANHYRPILFPLQDLSMERSVLADSLQFGLDGIFVIDCMSSVRPGDVTIPMITLAKGGFSEPDVAVCLAQGAYELTRHLQVTHRHRKVALVGLHLIQTTDKYKGFKKACAEHGETDPPVLCLSWNIHYEKELQALLESGVTAFVASNDALARRLIGYLESRGIRVPGQIAVVGFDGDMYSCSGPCRLTTAVQPMRDMAREGMRLMLEKLKAGDCSPTPPEQRVLLRPRLYLGDSCGCKPPPDKTICWEHLPFSPDGANDLIRPPPPEMTERFQLKPEEWNFF